MHKINRKQLIITVIETDPKKWYHLVNYIYNIFEKSSGSGLTQHLFLTILAINIQKIPENFFLAKITFAAAATGCLVLVAIFK